MDLLLYFLKGYPRRTILVFIGVTIASVITAVTLLALPALLATMLGRSTGKADIFNRYFELMGINPTTENLLIFLMVGIIIQNILLACSKIYAGFTVAKIVKDIRIQLLSSMSRTEWSYFIKQSSGEFSASIINEINQAGNGYTTMVDILSTIVLMAAYLSVAFFISWPIAVIAILTSLLLIIFFGKLISISKDLGAADTKLVRQLTAHVTDSYRGIKPLKAMGRESHSHSLLSDYAKKLKKVNKKSILVKEILNMLQEIVLMATIILTVYFSFDLLDIPLEFAIILVILYLRSMKLFGKTQKQYQNYVGNLHGYQTVIKTLEKTEKLQEKRPGKIKYLLEHNIVFDNVNFRHGKKLILYRVFATIYYKKLNSIVGESGAGKTTIVDLLAGLYKPTKGRISANGLSLLEMDIKQWRRQIGYVVQENTLLNTSIKENITLGDTDFSDTDIYTALEKVEALSFVMELPEQLDTIVGENGCYLSGGQRQRISIARAIVHSPRLLILDEATSALDKETEIQLSMIFKELSKEITILSISHRPAIVEISDNVIELRDNKLLTIKSPNNN